MEISQKTIDISKGNDLFRQDFNRDRIVFTASVDNSPHRNEIIQAVKSFNDFDDDERGEHNFGVFTVAGEEYIFKIDYMDTAFEFTEDPYDTSVFERSMTIMKSDEL